jgi:uncharacterized membrane protein
MLDARAPSRTGAEDTDQAGRSRASINGHPIHPMLVPLPIAAFLFLLATDVGYWLTADPFWARASLWLVGVGVVTGALAGAVGAVDFWAVPQARRHGAGWVHAIGNVAALLASVVNWGLRAGDPVGAVLPWGLVLSVVVAGLLAVTGWAGGELSYRYRVGVIPHAGVQRGS